MTHEVIERIKITDEEAKVLGDAERILKGIIDELIDPSYLVDEQSFPVSISSLLITSLTLENCRIFSRFNSINAEERKILSRDIWNDYGKIS